MANPTTNLNITLPVPGSESSRGSWGGTLNDGIQELDTAIAERGVPAGGTDDQVLTKNGTTDYATEWSNRLSSVGIVGTDGIEVDSGSPVTTSGNITIGINKATLLSFISAEEGATGDQNAGEIKVLYEQNTDTNAFTDALLTKLNGISASATNVTNNNQLTNGAGYLTSASANDGIFWENDQAVSSDYTINNNKNAMSAGPITINSGVTVTVGTGENWTIV